MPNNPIKPRLILASNSPRRKQLLEQAGLIFDVIPSGVDEAGLAAKSPAQHVRLLAHAKAAAVVQQYPDALVIGADTVVMIEQAILEKPASKPDAKAMLQKLGGRAHSVLTGYVIWNQHRGFFHEETIETRVRFKALTNDEIEWYLGTGESFDKAGAYAIQGQGAFMIQAISGSFTNVVGLPMSEVIDCLTRIGNIDHWRK